ncbi:hypothetical protein O9929_05810 [Vibrio lentus]|nr:hypothetical protein [Vibrio lentus]
MPVASLTYYLNGNYHKVADVKTAWVFVEPGMMTLGVLAIILLMRQHGDNVLFVVTFVLMAHYSG